MNPKLTLATASRVLAQLRNDPRTIALLILTPILLITLMKWVYLDQDRVFQRIGVPLVGIFPMTSMFLVTSITMLRERTSGTLERLLTTPLAKLDLLVGYAIAFGAVAVVQGALTSAVAFGLLGLDWGYGFDKLNPIPLAHEARSFRSHGPTISVRFWFRICG